MLRLFSCFSKNKKNKPTNIQVVVPMTKQIIPREKEIIIEQEQTNTSTNNMDKNKFQSVDDLVDELYRDLMSIRSYQERMETEEKLIRYLMTKKSKINYIIDISWSVAYTQQLRSKRKTQIGPVTNQSLEQTYQQNWENMRDEQDYISVNETIWKLIIKLYGGGPQILEKENLNISSLTSKSNYSEKQEQTPILEQIDQFILPRVGLENQSFYCYMNAGIQCLLSISELNQYFYDEKYRQGKQKGKKPYRIILLYSELVSTIKMTNKNYLNPKNFKSEFRDIFDPNEQHDCHEFLIYVLSEMQDELNPKIPKTLKIEEFKDSRTAWTFYKQYHNSIIDEIFAGQLLSRVSCKRCQNDSDTYQPFLQQQLSITDETSSLQECFDLYFSEEELIDQYNCAKCKKKVKAMKRMLIIQPPKVLIIHLKRFNFPSQKKITKKIKFPLYDFSISDYLANPTEDYTYNLKALSIHMGSLNSGHYVTAAKRQDKWYLFDDEQVTQLSEKEVAGKFAYLLFYQLNNY